ncbi:hypothetical protein LINPERHAP1_LOCUS24274 [Linum perenne]
MMSKKPEKIELDTEIRPWGDLCWDLLSSICSKLQHSGCNNDDLRSGFGFVCRNWHQFHSTNSINPQQPGTTRIGNHTFIVGNMIDRETIDLIWGVTMPKKITQILLYSWIAYIWDSGWWLLSSSCHRIIGCFNPLLDWPSSYIPLPALYRINYPGIPLPPITAAFSASPTSTSRDWTLLVVHSVFSFSTVRRGQWWWRFYFHSGRVSRVGVRVGYREGMFYILFETGDVLIFGIDDHKERRMMLTVDQPFANPFSTARFGHNKILRVVGESIVVSWERVGGDSKRLRLVRVEEREMAAEVKELEEGWRRSINIVVLSAREEANCVIKRNWTTSIRFTIVFGPLLALLGMVAYTISSRILSG